MYSDNLTFSEEGLANTIAVLDELKGEITVFKDRYLEYVSTNLKPNWTTTNGVKSVEDLNTFAETDIQNFINYLQRRIDNFRVTQKQLYNINNA